VTDQVCVVEHRKDPDRPRRALTGALCCGGCRKGLAFDLLDLPDMHDRLTERHTARSNGHSEVRSSGHTGLTLNDRVVRARGNIYTGLANWTKIVALEGNLQHLPADNVHAMARWLLGHRASMLDWICEHDWVEQIVNNMDVLHREAFGLLYPRGRRRFPIKLPNGQPATCIEVTSSDVATRQLQRCPGEMVATLTDPDDDFPPLIWCSDCGFEVAGNQWINYGRRYLEATGVSA